jgi:lysophospholipid acyltransferase (LPLAT)-like uncharacterized protein
MIHIIVQHILWFIFYPLLKSYRFTVQGREHVPQGAYVFSVWHEQVFMVLGAHAWTGPFMTLASRSKDGDYAAFICKKLGFVPVRGSSRKKNKDKGGKEAMQEYVSRMNEGGRGGITVDGPRGPRQVCKVGIVLIAQQTGAPIVPVVAVGHPVWEFNSWDRFKLPKFFSKVTMLYGEPIMVDKEATPERIDEYCRLVETRMKELELKVRA